MKSPQKTKFKSTETYHFYLPNGKTCHGTIEEGKKAGAYPSVTTVLSIIHKEFVEKYKIREAISAALLLPRKNEESLKDFSERCILHTERTKNLTTDFGTKVHKAIENFHLAHKLHQQGKLPNPPTPESSSLELPEVLPWLKHYVNWFHQNVKSVVMAEYTTVSQLHGYAGQIDAIVILKNEKTAILDFKTQKLKEKLPYKNANTVLPELPKGPKKPNDEKIEFWPASFYETWLLQLTAYQESLAETKMQKPQNLISVVLNSQEPSPIQHYIWPEKNHQKAFQAFLCAHTLWKWVNEF